MTLPCPKKVALRQVLVKYKKRDAMIYRLMIKRISDVSSHDIPDGNTQRFVHRLLLKLKEHDFDMGGDKDAIAVYFK